MYTQGTQRGCVGAADVSSVCIGLAQAFAVQSAVRKKKKGTRTKARVSPLLTCPGEEEETRMRSVWNVVGLKNE